MSAPPIFMSVTSVHHSTITTTTDRASSLPSASPSSTMVATGASNASVSTARASAMATAAALAAARVNPNSTPSHELTRSSDQHRVTDPGSNDHRSTSGSRSSSSSVDLADIYDDLERILELQRQRLQQVGADVIRNVNNVSSGSGRRGHGMLTSDPGRRGEGVENVPDDEEDEGDEEDNDVERELVGRQPNHHRQQRRRAAHARAATLLKPHQLPLPPANDADAFPRGRTFSPIFPLVGPNAGRESATRGVSGATQQRADVDDAALSSDLWKQQHQQQQTSQRQQQPMSQPRSPQQQQRHVAQPPRPVSAAAVFAPGTGTVSPHLASTFEGSPDYKEFLAQLRLQQRQHDEVLRRNSKARRRGAGQTSPTTATIAAAEPNVQPPSLPPATPALQQQQHQRQQPNMRNVRKVNSPIVLTGRDGQGKLRPGIPSGPGFTDEFSNQEADFSCTATGTEVIDVNREEKNRTHHRSRSNRNRTPNRCTMQLWSSNLTNAAAAAASASITPKAMRGEPVGSQLSPRTLHNRSQPQHYQNRPNSRQHQQLQQQQLISKHQRLSPSPPLVQPPAFVTHEEGALSSPSTIPEDEAGEFTDLSVPPRPVMAGEPYPRPRLHSPSRANDHSGYVEGDEEEGGQGRHTRTRGYPELVRDSASSRRAVRGDNDHSNGAGAAAYAGRSDSAKVTAAARSSGGGTALAHPLPIPTHESARIGIDGANGRDSASRGSGAPVEPFADILNEEVMRNSASGWGSSAAAYAAATAEATANNSSHVNNNSSITTQQWGAAPPILTNARSPFHKGSLHASPIATTASAAATMASGVTPWKRATAAEAMVGAPVTLGRQRRVYTPGGLAQTDTCPTAPAAAATTTTGNGGGLHPTIHVDSVSGSPADPDSMPVHGRYQDPLQDPISHSRGCSRTHHYRRSRRPIMRVRRTESSLILERDTATPRSGRAGASVRRGLSSSGYGGNGNSGRESNAREGILNGKEGPVIFTAPPTLEHARQRRSRAESAPIATQHAEEGFEGKHHDRHHYHHDTSSGNGGRNANDIREMRLEETAAAAAAALWRSTRAKQIAGSNSKSGYRMREPPRRAAAMPSRPVDVRGVPRLDAFPVALSRVGNATRRTVHHVAVDDTSGGASAHKKGAVDSDEARPLALPSCSLADGLIGVVLAEAVTDARRKQRQRDRRQQQALRFF